MASFISSGVLNYIAIGIPISMWLSSTMTLDFPRVFSMVMHIIQ